MLKTIHIGVGNRGLWPIEIMGPDERFAPVALVDVNPEALRIARQKLDLPESACFHDPDEALEQVECDAVITCSPTTLHAKFCRSAFQRHRHVLVEKGMTYNWDEARALVREAEAAGVKFCVAQNFRYHQNYRTLRSILETPGHPEHPGAARFIDFTQHRYRPDPRTLTFPFSMVWDLAVHHLDLLILLLGPIHRVHAHTYGAPWSRYNHEANVSAFLEFRNGAICNYGLTHDGRFNEMRLLIQGERGALQYVGSDGFGSNELVFHPIPGAGEPRVISIPKGPSSAMGVTDAFFDYLTGGIEPGISGRRNLETLAGCEMIQRSAGEGRTVERSEL